MPRAPCALSDAMKARPTIASMKSSGEPKVRTSGRTIGIAKAIMALRSAPEVIARPYVLPPNTPADIVKVYRDAFAATIKDPALVAESQKAQFDLDYTSGDQAMKVLKEVLSQPKDIVDEFSKYVKFGE